MPLAPSRDKPSHPLTYYLASPSPLPSGGGEVSFCPNGTKRFSASRRFEHGPHEFALIPTALVIAATTSPSPRIRGGATVPGAGGCISVVSLARAATGAGRAPRKRGGSMMLPSRVSRSSQVAHFITSRFLRHRGDVPATRHDLQSMIGSEMPDTLSVPMVMR